MIGIYIIGGILVLLIIYVIALYNGLIKLKVRVQNAWSQIDNQLKRRHDLIPNLIETVKGYAKHEKELFEQVADARARSMGGNIAEQAEASDELTKGISKIIAVGEAYPELKANSSFEKLQVELVGTEDKIAFARQFYNDSVQAFNQKLMMFPTNIIGNMLGFTSKEFFQVADKEKANVKVKF